MNATKWAALALYAILLAGLLLCPHAPVPRTIGWIFIVLGAVHLLEFVLVARRLAALDGSLAKHFLHTLLFGFVHWKPLLRN